MHRNPAAGSMHSGHNIAQDFLRDWISVIAPVSDELGPAGARRLFCGHRRQLVQLGASAPAIKELAVLRDPWPGVDGTWQVGILAEPIRWLSRQARGPDKGDTCASVLAQVRPQHVVIKRLANVLSARMGMGIDQP